MRLRWTPVLSVLLALICLWTTPCAAVNDSVPLCSRSPLSYAGAKKDHPSLASALDTLEKRGIATWYSDRVVNGDYTTTAQEIVTACGDDTRLSIVVYGLPNKDCEAGYSSSNGVVQNADDYATFIDTLVETVGDRKALYVLEPDAVGLIADGGCAVEFGYKQNLLVAIEKLTVNENAEIYVDVGFWTLYDPAKAASVAAVVRELVVAGRGRVKGITLNTSNYRPTKDMAQLCGAFQTAYNSTDMHCIIDTARNFNDTSSEEWCNRRTGGIGHPPTSNTGIENIDYFVWIKPPGESDGECDKGHSSESMVGPEAGVFFPEAFVLLWNNGYLHEVEGMPEVSIKSKGSKHTVVIVLCVLAVVAIAAVAFFVQHRRRTKEAGLNYSRAYFA